MATEPLPQVEAALAELVALFEHWHQTRATVQERIRNRGILLDHGQILLDSDPKPAIDRYQALDLQRRNAQTAMLISPTRTAPEPTGSPAVIPEPASTADNDPDAETSPADRKEAALTSALSDTELGAMGDIATGYAIIGMPLRGAGRLASKSTGRG